MTSKANGADPEPQQAVQVKMNVLNQYVRDLSFENILSQTQTDAEVSPELKVDINLNALKRKTEHVYEVSIELKVNSVNKATEDTLFILELDYVGVFRIEGVPEENMSPVLHIECPRLMFPFLRRIVSDVTRDGGFPPLNLDNIDFAHIYRNLIMRQKKSEESKEKKADV
ncbi:MAG: protein-export chaperone SecB [Roseovarius sp.]|nr:protein-export chaperone SecB [Roseovarius sp.]MCY4207448.1 protein-export chaperone SecB [Roseovarius sp.]MCY4314978.1 protein-export chaperone SecB [Roseovarius sp.]